MAAVSLFAIHLASSFFFSGFTVAQISAPSCNSTISGWNWTINSLDQNPCLVAAYLLSTCNGGSYVLASSNMYPGPLASADDGYNPCMCSTVTYSLLSACSGCQMQDGSWHYWSKYAFNCTTTSPLSFPNPVPLGTAIPQWALLDVTNENIWDYNQSLATGDTPEIPYGGIISNSRASASSTSTLNVVTSNTARPSPNKVHTSNVGDLVGGIVGGILAVAIIVSMMFLYRRRRQPASSTRDDVFNQHWNSDQVQSPFLGQETPTLYPSEVTRSPSQETRHYNPDDSNTSLENLGAPNSGAQGYHGPPIIYS